jgi:DNA-binding LytR/AlgR family response regulator
MQQIDHEENMPPEWESLLLPVEYKTRFLVRTGQTCVMIFTHDIAYFFIDHKVTYAVTESAKRYALDETLDELESGLNPKEYFRLNRQCIANIRSIDKLHLCFHGKLKIELKPHHEREIVVGREKVAALKQWLDW